MTNRFLTSISEICRRIDAADRHSDSLVSLADFFRAHPELAPVASTTPSHWIYKRELGVDWRASKAENEAIYGHVGRTLHRAFGDVTKDANEFTSTLKARCKAIDIGFSFGSDTCEMVETDETELVDEYDPTDDEEEEIDKLQAALDAATARATRQVIRNKTKRVCPPVLA